MLTSRALPAPYEAFPKVWGRHRSTGQGEEWDLPLGQESACLRPCEPWGQGPPAGCPTAGLAPQGQHSGGPAFGLTLYRCLEVLNNSE